MRAELHLWLCHHPTFLGNVQPNRANEKSRCCSLIAYAIRICQAIDGSLPGDRMTLGGSHT